MILIQIYDVILFLIFIAVFLYTGMKRDLTIFFILLTLFYCYYDWVYLLTKNYVNYSITFISGYAKELSVYILCLLFIGIRIVKYRKYKEMVPAVIVLTATSTLGIINYGLNAFLISFNSYVPMFLFLIILCQMNCYTNKIKYLNACFILVVIPNSIYALYQYYFYHAISDFWFYDAFKDMDLALNEWDYFRNGYVRPFGFFSNTLSLTFFCFFVLAGASIYLKKFKFTSMIIAFIPALLSGTRTVFIVFFLFICLLVVYKIKMHYKLKTYMYIFVILASFIGTLYTIVSLSGDLSSLGRVVQWVDVLSDIKNNPLGHGIGYAGVGLEKWPDSNIIAFIYMTGYIGVFYSLYFLIKLSVLLSKTSNQSYLLLLLTLYVALFQNISSVMFLPILAISIKSFENIPLRCRI